MRGVDTAPRLAQLLALADQGCKAALEGDPGEHLVFLGQEVELAHLLGGDRRRFLDEEVAAPLDDAGGQVVEVVGRHDGPDRVGLLLLDHLRIVGVSSGDAELVAGGLGSFQIEVADGHQLSRGDLGEGRVVGGLGAAAGADDGDLDLLAGLLRSCHGVLLFPIWVPCRSRPRIGAVRR